MLMYRFGVGGIGRRPEKIRAWVNKTSKTSFRDVGDRRSGITLLKTYEPTKRASIQTRREEIDYGEHDRHVFVKSLF